MQKLDERKWDLVKQATAVYAGSALADKEDEEVDEGDNDPHACSEVWYVHCYWKILQNSKLTERQSYRSFLSHSLFQSLAFYNHCVVYQSISVLHCLSA